MRGARERSRSRSWFDGGGVALAVLLAACGGAPKRPPSAIEQSRLLLVAGDEARALGDPASAARAYARALASARAGDDRALAADAGYRLGVSLLAAGESREAAVQLEDAARAASAAGEPRLRARSLLALARALQESDAGDPAVRDALGRALEAARAAGDEPGEALAHVGLAALSDEAGAREHLATAERLAGGVPAVAAPLALNRARRAERDRDPGAGGLYRLAAERYRELEDAPGLFEALSGAARAADAGPGAAEAAELHRSAAAAALRSGAPASAVAELRLAAAAHARAGDAAGAARRGEEADRLAREAGLR